MAKEEEKIPEDIWKNRIIGQGEKPAKEFNFNPLNFREHPPKLIVLIHPLR